MNQPGYWVINSLVQTCVMMPFEFLFGATQGCASVPRRQYRVNIDLFADRL